MKNIKENKNKNKLFYIMYIIFTCLLIYSSFKIINYIIETKKTKDTINNISKSIVIQENNENENNENENVHKYKIDFKTLKAKNPDVVGFLKVRGTEIETVVVKGKNNSYYLTHNIEKESNTSGWIFADYRNKIDGKDKNIVIYGHNMQNNTMFGTLKNILNKKWQKNKENRYIDFVTDEKESVYEVFSVYQIEVEDYYIKTDFKGGEFKKYIEKMKKRSIYNFDVAVDEKDKILTLSTCANDNRYRIVLHAKEVKEL